MHLIVPHVYKLRNAHLLSVPEKNMGESNKAACLNLELVCSLCEGRAEHLAHFKLRMPDFVGHSVFGRKLWREPQKPTTEHPTKTGIINSPKLSNFNFILLFFINLP